MNEQNQKFDIIRFTPDEKRYYPASMRKQKFMGDEYVKHTKIEIPLGKSRYGGCVIDLPKDVKHPKNMRFAAQLDLTEFAPFDKTGLLPKTGQLIVFADIMEDKGKVIYADVPNSELERQIVEHEDNFWDGVLIDKVFTETETLSERFIVPEDEDDKKFANEDGKIWDWFAGSEKSKIFGIYTNCQMDKKAIEKIVFSNKVVLLQVGEGGFNDEGVFSVLIDKDDLKSRNFNKCKFVWAQS